MSRADPPMRPSHVCAALLGALEASAGRSRRRMRDQKPDAFGLALKAALLRDAVADDPDPQRFEEWLMSYVLAREPVPGTLLAVARQVLDEWRLAHAMPQFGVWLAFGAPSADAPARAAAEETQATPARERE